MGGWCPWGGPRTTGVGVGPKCHASPFSRGQFWGAFHVASHTVIRSFLLIMYLEHTSKLFLHKILLKTLYWVLWTQILFYIIWTLYKTIVLRGVYRTWTLDIKQEIRQRDISPGDNLLVHLYITVGAKATIPSWRYSQVQLCQEYKNVKWLNSPVQRVLGRFKNIANRIYLIRHPKSKTREILKIQGWNVKCIGTTNIEKIKRNTTWC